MIGSPSATSTKKANEYSMSKSEFEFISAKAKNEFGLSLSSDKLSLVQSRLSKRLRLLSIDSFSTYCSLLSTAKGQQEAMHMLSALTTNVTHFFREMHHFEALAEEILPRLMLDNRLHDRIRIWSAGCSAGQEPYSIAATVLAKCPELLDRDFKILATDVDPEILKSAMSGKYSAEGISRIPNDFSRPLFLETKENELVINPELVKLIKFARLNLIGDWPMSGKFDVIFCRNVAIYFDKETQARLWKRFHEILKSGGILCIGHSERLTEEIEQKFENVGLTMYRRLGN